MNIKDVLRVLLSPDCWIQVHPFSAAWDKRLQWLMETNAFVPVDRFTAKIGGVEVWVQNHPYGSFTPYARNMSRIAMVRPRRSTILKAADKLKSDTPSF